LLLRARDELTAATRPGRMQATARPCGIWRICACPANPLFGPLARSSTAS